MSKLGAAVAEGLAPPSYAQSVSVEVNLQEVRALLRHDPEFFLHFFLTDIITGDVPPFHSDIFREMTHEEVLRVVLAIPRGHAKTTLAKLACVWYLLFSDYSFVLYVSGGHDMVVPYVNDIIAFLETDNFRAVFGEIDWFIRQEGKGIFKFRVKSLGKVCILRGLGAGQRVRGINVDNKRPQLVVADDIEDDDNVANEQNHRKMMNWFFGTLTKALDPIKNKIIAAGNLLSTMSVLYRLLESPAWRSYLYGCLKADGTPLWPEVWSIEKLREDFKEYQRLGLVARWFAEMMNMPIPEGGAVITGEEICYQPMRFPDDLKFGFITVDPAVSKERWADRAAVVAHGWVEDEQQWQIVEKRSHHGIDLVDLFWDIIDLAAKWGFRCIGVENDAMQKAVGVLFQHLQLTNGLNQYLFLPVQSYKQRKSERIATWAAMLKQTKDRRAMYALTQGDYDITQQLLVYQPARKKNQDDIIDSCSYGVQMISRYLHEIMKYYAVAPQGRIGNLYNVADC